MLICHTGSADASSFNPGTLVTYLNNDGDLVVVKKQVEAKEGDIVVALVDNQNTLKRYFRDDENKKIILHPENKKMKDIIVDECCIQGVACHIIKEL